MSGVAKFSLQTTRRRKKQKPVKRGFKQPPRDLAEWIRLANLIPPGTVIAKPDIRPSGAEDYWTVVLEWIARLPESLREELLSLDDYPRTEHSTAFLRAVYVLQHAQKIDIASTCLRALTES